MSALDAIINRSRPSWSSLFIQAPLKTLAKTLYALRTPGETPAQLKRTLRVVCVSDTHNSQPKIPDGDVLVHAGDLTQTGTFQELQEALNWLNRLPHEKVITIAGNHDLLLDRSYRNTPQDQKDRAALVWGRVIYLEDENTLLPIHNGRYIKVWGTPWTRKHGNWAFQFPPNARPEEMISEHDLFDQIPTDTDILISHMPPRFHLDIDGFGSEALLEAIKRTKPQLHVFGHVHEGYGTESVTFDAFQECYERVCRGVGGIVDLLSMLWRLMFGQARPGVRGTILVNPAAVGGLRDTERRLPMVVDL